MAHFDDKAKPIFTGGRLKAAAIALAFSAAMAPSLAGAVSIYHAKFGYCVDWGGSFEDCNAWASFSDDFACFMDPFPTAPGSDQPVIQLSPRGEVILTAGRQSRKYAMLSPEGKRALGALDRKSSPAAVHRAMEEAFATSIKVIPSAEVNALAERYKARIVKIGPK